MMGPKSNLLFWISGLLCVSGCTGVSEITGVPPLPFYVALMPIETIASDPLGAAPAEEGGRGPVELFELAIDGASLTRRLKEELEKDCFTRVSILDPAEIPDEEFAGEENVKDWVVDVRQKYNLVFQGTVLYSRKIESGRNTALFWANLPLFLIGGPFCYFVPDRYYSVHATLEWQLQDLNELARRSSWLQGGKAVLAAAESTPQDVSLNFLDRTGWKLGSYLLSVVIPAGLLSKENPTVKAAVEEAAVASLCTEVAGLIRERAEDISRAVNIFNFYVDRKTLAIAPTPTGVLFRADVVHRAGGPDLVDFRITAGPYRETLVFRDRIVDTDRDQNRYKIQEEIPITSETRWIHLQIQEPGREPRTRDYTFDVSAYVAPPSELSQRAGPAGPAATNGVAE